jgi:hypothetical protein
MSATAFTPFASLLGGALIGLAATSLLALNGRIAGISGIAWNALKQRGDERRWRLAFVLGLLLGAALWFRFGSDVPALRSGFSWPLLVASGGLVGLGTRLGSGCTSGHGICGLARFSRRSLVAVLVFMGCAMLTTTVVRHVLG